MLLLLLLMMIALNFNDAVFYGEARFRGLTFHSFKTSMLMEVVSISSFMLLAMVE